MTYSKHKKQYIYYLKTGDDIFYVGRTSDPERREREHRYSKKTGTELKYQAIREFEANNLEWHLEVKCECTEEYDEDFAVYQALLSGACLTNMKKGDVYEEATTLLTDNYTTPSQFFKAREVKVKELLLLKERNKTKKKREVQHSGESAFIDDLSDVINGRRESPALKAIKARRNKKYEKG